MPINEQDVFKGNIFENAIKQADAYLKKINNIIKNLKMLSQISVEGIEGLKPAVIKDYETLNKKLKETIVTQELITEAKKEAKQVENELIEVKKKAIKTDEQLYKIEKDIHAQQEVTNKTAKQRIIISQEEIKATEKITYLKSAQAKIDIENKLIIAELNKKKTEQVKISLGLVNAYQIESKKLVELKARYKSLAVQEKENTEEGRALLASITELDTKLKGIDKSVGETGREVGNYTDSIREAVGESVNFGEAQDTISKILQVVTVGFKKYKEQTNKATESLGANARGIDKLGAKLKGLGKAVVASGIGLLIVGLGAVTASFGDTRSGSIALQGTIAKVVNGFKFLGSYIVDYIVPAFNKFANSAKITGLEIQESFSFGAKAKSLRQEIKALEEEQKGYNKQIDEFKNRKPAEEFGKVLDASERLVIAQIDLTEKTQKYNKEIAKRQKTEEILIAIADDDTRSFIERSKARVEYNKLAEADILATSKKLQLARLEVENVKSQLELSKQVNANGEESLSLRQKLTDAEITLTEAEKEASIKKIENAQKLRKQLFDEIEQTLDLEIDGTDKIIEANFKRIESDKETFEERNRLVLENEKLIKDSNNRAIDALAKTVEGLTGDKIRKAFQDSGDDLALFNENLKKLGLAEIPINRVREVFIRMKTQISETDTAMGALNDSFVEFTNLQKEIQLQEEFLKSGFKKDGLQSEEQYNARLREIRIENLEEKLLTLKKGSKEELEIQKELNDLNLELEKEKLDKENLRAEEQKAKEDKAREDKLKAEQEAIEILSTMDEAYANKKLANIDKQIQASQKEQDRLKEIASKNSTDQSKGIIEAEKKQIELEKKKEKIIKARLRRENLLMFNGYVMKALADEADKTPLLTAIKEMAKTQVASNLVVGGKYKNGSDFIGNGKGSEVKVHNGTDGHLGWLDYGEMVFDNKESNELRGLGFGTRKSVIEALKLNTSSLKIIPVGQSQSELIDINKQVVSILQNLPNNMPSQNINYNPFFHHLVEENKRGNSRSVRLQKIGKLA